VGVAAAIAGEIATGLLLYRGPGLMRSVTVVLATELAALAWGLHLAPRRGPGWIDALRRRWLLCLVAFVAATAFAAQWTFTDDVATGRWDQGVGLALLGALPLFGCGTVLGGMSLRGRVGSTAFLGAAVGVVLAGAALPHTPTPASLLLGALVLLSGAALLFGAALEEEITARVLGSPPPAGSWWAAALETFGGERPVWGTMLIVPAGVTRQGKERSAAPSVPPSAPVVRLSGPDVEDRERSYEVVFVDVPALEEAGGATETLRELRDRVARLVAPGGIVAWRLAGAGDADVEMGPGWSWARYGRRPAGPPDAEGAPSATVPEENLLVARRAPAVPWPETLDGFVRRASSSAAVP